MGRPQRWAVVRKLIYSVLRQDFFWFRERKREHICTFSYIHVCIQNLYIYVRACTLTGTNKHTHILTCAGGKAVVHICLLVFTLHICMRACMHACMHVCVHVSTYTCTYTLTYTRMHRWWTSGAGNITHASLYACTRLFIETCIDTYMHAHWHLITHTHTHTHHTHTYA